ncbi:MAG: LysM peptidoglycan-binding domain-containing protein [Hyphomicrobiales bacterium]|nr:MAG: LysM peptidoglycan-binding domain-containing protein [Hyphomicrobiales bacterium]
MQLWVIFHLLDHRIQKARKLRVGSTTHKYKFLGRYLQTESHTQQKSRLASTMTWHDANGFISNIEQREGVSDTRFNRAFVNDAQGNALYVNQGAAGSAGGGGRIQNLPGGYIGGFIGTALYPGHVQRQLVANGEVVARFGDAPDLASPPQDASKKPNYINTAEFHLDAAPLQLKGANFSAMSYTVVGGETLKSIARTVLGDSSLWWRIAEANGLAVSADGALTAGQTLSIPKLSLNANNSDTFQPYDPAKVTGSQDSVLPAPEGRRTSRHVRTQVIRRWRARPGGAYNLITATRHDTIERWIDGRYELCA